MDERILGTFEAASGLGPVGSRFVVSMFCVG